jgi:hypothetical protein
VGSTAIDEHVQILGNSEDKSLSVGGAVATKIIDERNSKFPDDTRRLNDVLLDWARDCGLQPHDYLDHECAKEVWRHVAVTFDLEGLRGPFATSPICV